MDAALAGSTHGSQAAWQAIKASGAIVDVEPDAFTQVVRRLERPLVLVREPTTWSRKHRYLVAYKGFVLHTKSKTALVLPNTVELVRVKRVWTPSSFY